ncbi:hypothetical protein AXF42_Ash006507 [Apostasia shenzhenica]|uniref:Uncharacterized protein n=1 Tax=Apostasia shenzhenica TaxID=1088818 RepID=A0A2I0AZA1_9ASPA|nr:hypothetical protein AXF42_Ash006507 [Apostasia shenzhenica]
MQSLQDHSANSSLSLISELRTESYAVVQNNYFPFEYLQAGLDANLLHTDVLPSNPRPLRAVPASDAADSGISPQINYDIGIEASGKSYNPGSSYVDHLKNIFFSDAGPSRADLSIPIVDNADTQAKSSLTRALCPATVVDSYENLMVQMIGYSSTLPQGEKGSILKNMESENPARVCSYYWICTISALVSVMLT